MKKPRLEPLTYDNWRRVCKQVLDNCKDLHARAYADAGLTLHELYSRESGLLSDAVKWQAGYLRGNLGEWAGAEARECKRWLDAYQKRGLC